MRPIPLVLALMAEHTFSLYSGHLGDLVGAKKDYGRKMMQRLDHQVRRMVATRLCVIRKRADRLRRVSSTPCPGKVAVAVAVSVTRWVSGNKG